MTDTDLIVPIELHALVANENVRKQEGYFTRWVPSFSLMVDPTEKYPGEPRPYENGELVHENDLFEGVHLQWELPEALTTGYFHPETGDSVFPLVPNRWLVVRYSTIGTTRRTAGWVVHSDCLASDGLGVATSNPYLNPHAERPTYDRIGRAHALSDGPWREPNTPRGLFLTAIGAGLPAFAAFAAYHKNVFHFQDTLEDLGVGGRRPATATLSYCVLGWYSDDDADILRRAADIPSLLPPDARQRGLHAVLEALGWRPPSNMPDTIERTRYSGTALGVEWKHKIGFPGPALPDPSDVPVAIGQSLDEAAEALVNHQSQQPGTGELVRALFLGNPDSLDDADGPIDLNELMRRSWFAGRDGGYLWRVVNRVGDDADTPHAPPAQPDWLDTLNADQATHDTAAAALADAQWRLWSLWWLRHLPADHRPSGFQFDATEWDNKVSALTTAARDRQRELAAARAEIPWHEDPAELPTAICEYATNKGLPRHQELIRAPRAHYHRPNDPVLVLTGSGATRPLGRDGDDPLPCRLPAQLLTEVRVGSTTLRPESNPLAPNISGLEWAKPLIAEMAMLDQAARTATGTDTTALHDIIADPDTFTEGPFPEYTRVWGQPWLPLFLQWEVDYCPTPLETDGTDHWEFYDDGYHWKGTGAPSGDGVGALRWTHFTGRAFLTPAIPYVLREQTRRLIDSAGAEFAGPLRNLMEDFGKLELLSQNLDGFNDWLLQLDGAAQPVTDAAILTEAGQSNHVPDGAGDRRQRRFQPVRAGQFYFTDLRIIDRFGRALRLVGPEQQQPIDFEPVRATSVVAEKPLSTPPLPNQDRFIQLPPRLLQDTRLVFEPVRHQDDAPLTAASSTEPGMDTPVAGWVLVNNLDRTLLVYAPDGSPLGELRMIRQADAIDALAWTALPHAAFAEPEEFAAVYPHMAGFVVGLREAGLAAFTDLIATIDNALDAITDPAPEEDRAPARLIGRPVALVRARLGVELLGPTLTDPSWDTALNPPEENYPAHRWPIRLGEYQQLADGLIGYFTSELGEDTDYRTLCVTDWISVGMSGYLAPIGTGAALALPARPVDQPMTRCVTLLVCPHTAVHATTDILPVATLKVDAEVTHRALAAVRASFRLNPLLAPERPGGTAIASTSLTVDPAHPVELMLDGDLSTCFRSTAHPDTSHWVMLDLGSERNIAEVHFYQGDGHGPHERTLHSGIFEYSIDEQAWRPLGDLPDRVEEHHLRLPDPVAGRYVRLRSTSADNGMPWAIRRFDVVTDPADGGVVMPKPASWFGDWTWAEPQTGDGHDMWTDLSILAADTAAHFGDAIPIARAGYLQLRPTGLEEEGTR
ncbi:discoidin domain-containing protein [Nocardia sp. NBC_00881]|uniref:discoidin domain-containing protein n=1 Tax=Nocardia sp. NBC_00881 TaxID=2975995 RepID=UPI0038709D45|nr:discoidin domain-containing protein [Nocardia sp. NBC_00881]